jgi:hypothetical protein
MSKYELTMFDQICVTARKMGEEVFTEPDSDWAPIAFFSTPDGQMPMMPLVDFMQNEDTKETLATLILPAVISQYKASAVIIVLSVWTAKLKPGEQWGKGSLMPSERPDRGESLMISEYLPTGVRTVFAEIERRKDLPPLLGEWEEMDGAHLTGRFIEPIVTALKDVEAA